jgi:hypothetical protein
MWKFLSLKHIKTWQALTAFLILLIPSLYGAHMFMSNKVIASHDLIAEHQADHAKLATIDPLQLKADHDKTSALEQYAKNKDISDQKMVDSINNLKETVTLGMRGLDEKFDIILKNFLKMTMADKNSDASKLP